MFEREKKVSEASHKDLYKLLEALAKVGAKVKIKNALGEYELNGDSALPEVRTGFADTTPIETGTQFDANAPRGIFHNPVQKDVPFGVSGPVEVEDVSHPGSLEKQALEKLGQEQQAASARGLT